MISHGEAKVMRSVSILLTLLLAACQSAGPYVSYDGSVLEQVQTELEQSREAASIDARVVPRK